MKFDSCQEDVLREFEEWITNQSNITLNEKILEKQIYIMKSFFNKGNLVIKKGRQVGTTTALVGLAWGILKNWKSDEPLDILYLTSRFEVEKVEKIFKNMSALPENSEISGKPIVESHLKLTIGDGSFFKSLKKYETKLFDLVIVDEAVYVNYDYGNLFGYHYGLKKGGKMIVASTPHVLSSRPVEGMNEKIDVIRRNEKLFVELWKSGKQFFNGHAIQNAISKSVNPAYPFPITVKPADVLSDKELATLLKTITSESHRRAEVYVEFPEKTKKIRRTS